MNTRHDDSNARVRALPFATLLAAILSLTACTRPEAANTPAASATTDSAAPAPRSTAAGAETSGEVVYVSNEDSNDLTVISAADNRVIETIPVGTRPRGVKV